MNKQFLPGKLYGLDHLRALAIMLVFLFHYQIRVFAHPEWVPDVAQFGWTGVDLFFVLSGFLISSQLFAQIKKGTSISLKGFFIKRVFRILPAFFVIVAIYFLFPDFHEREHLPPLWRLLTFTQNFGLDLKEHGTFSHAWSLCVEEHFYLLLPFMLVLLKAKNYFRKGYLVLIILFLAGLGIRAYTWNNYYLPNIQSESAGLYWYKYIYYPTYNRLDGLLAGVSIAGLYHFLPITWSKISCYGNQLLLLSFVLLTGAYLLCLDQDSYSASVFGFPLVALGYGVMVCGAISPTSILYKWNSKATTLIATLSYSIYLSHKGVIHLAQKTDTFFHIDASSNLMLIVCVVSCIFAALLLHVVIEKPFMKLRDRVISHSAKK